MTASATGDSVEHAIGPNGLLSIRLRDGRARLRGVDRDAVRIRDDHGRDLSDLFEIELGDGSASFRAGRSTPDVEIDVPRAATVIIETGSGDIKVTGLVGDQRYRTASGDMKLHGVSGRVAVEAVSGDVEISATGDTAVIIKTVSGDVELRAATITALDANTTSGDLRIAGRLAGPGPFAIVTVSGDTLLAPAGDVRIDMKTLSGDLRSKVGGKTEGSRGHRSLVVGAGGALVSLRSLSGDLLVVPPSPVRAPTVARLDDTEPHAEPEPRTDTGADVPNGAIAAAYDEARLRILRSLERGEIDVAEAGLRLEALDGVDPLEERETAKADPVEPDDSVDPGTETARFDPNGKTDA